jgi:hypothetical protein
VERAENRPFADCTLLDRNRNNEIRYKLTVSDIVEDVTSYRKRWKDHVDRIGEDLAENRGELQF